MLMHGVSTPLGFLFEALSLLLSAQVATGQLWSSVSFFLGELLCWRVC